MDVKPKLEILLVELRRINVISQEVFDTLAEPETKLLAKVFHIAHTSPTLQPAEPKETAPHLSTKRLWKCPQCGKEVKGLKRHVQMKHEGQAAKIREKKLGGAPKSIPESLPENIPNSTPKQPAKGRLQREAEAKFGVGNDPQKFSSGPVICSKCGMEVSRSKLKEHQQSQECRDLAEKTRRIY